MGTRSVRLDEEAEQALRALTAATGASVSEILERGVLVLRDQAFEGSGPDAWLAYKELDLGPGGYAVAPARDSRRAIQTLLAGRRRRPSR
jgi:hypothetical protein